MIRVEDRDDLIAKLAADNIGTGIHYPIPLHLQKAYGHLGYKEGDFPVSERLAKEIVSLPMYPNLTEEQQSRVCQAVGQIFADRDVPQESRPLSWFHNEHHAHLPPSNPCNQIDRRPSGCRPHLQMIPIAINANAELVVAPLYLRTSQA